MIWILFLQCIDYAYGTLCSSGPRELNSSISIIAPRIHRGFVNCPDGGFCTCTRILSFLCLLFCCEHQVPKPQVPPNALTSRYRLMKQRDKQTHKGSANKLRVEQLKRKETRKDNMLKKRVTPLRITNQGKTEQQAD